MDPVPSNIVLEELRDLITDLEAAREPSNPILAQAVWTACRKTRPEMHRQPKSSEFWGFTMAIGR